MMAYADGMIAMHDPIKVWKELEIDGKKEHRIIDATVGRLIINDAIPQNLGFKKRETVDDQFPLEIDFVVGKKQLGKIIDKCIRINGFTQSTEMLDKVKALGYKYSTRASITVSIADMEIPEKKYELIHEAEKEVVKIDRQFKRGFITNDERYRLTVQQWEKSIKDVTDALQSNLKRFNPIFMMADSGARGSMNQIRQLAGMRGLMADTNGRTIEIPIKANFREGLSALEYFISSRGARKGMTDTALRTADSGYLTRRMVDVCQDVIIRENDCGSTNGSWKGDYLRKGPAHRVLRQPHPRPLPGLRYRRPEDGRAAALQGRHAPRGGRGQVRRPHGIDTVYVRSVLGCKARSGVCAKLLRHEPGDERAREPRRGGRHHRRAVHRRAGHAADHAYLPHRRRRRRRYHAGSSPSRRTLRGQKAEEDGADLRDRRRRRRSTIPTAPRCATSPSPPTTARSSSIRSRIPSA